MPKRSRADVYTFDSHVNHVQISLIVGSFGTVMRFFVAVADVVVGYLCGAECRACVGLLNAKLKCEHMEKHTKLLLHK